MALKRKRQQFIASSRPLHDFESQSKPVPAEVLTPSMRQSHLPQRQAFAPRSPRALPHEAPLVWSRHTPCSATILSPPLPTSPLPSLYFFNLRVLDSACPSGLTLGAAHYSRVVPWRRLRTLSSLAKRLCCCLLALHVVTRQRLGCCSQDQLPSTHHRPPRHLQFTWQRVWYHLQLSPRPHHQVDLSRATQKERGSELLSTITRKKQKKRAAPKQSSTTKSSTAQKRRGEEAATPKRKREEYHHFSLIHLFSPPFTSLLLYFFYFFILFTVLLCTFYFLLFTCYWFPVTCHFYSNLL